MTPVTLLTDFGHRDPYVGVMKGVMLGIHPDITTIDLTHQVARQDVREGAYQLARAAPWFPPGTVHLAVVDPGVGSQRRAVAARGRRHLYVGPDNGLLWLALEQDAPFQCFEVRPGRHTLEQLSNTFHGRDVFAPVAAHLARGVPPEEIGPPMEPLQLLLKPNTTVSGGVRTSVLLVDGFGNLITNLLRAAATEALEVEVSGQRIRLFQSYAQVEPGELLALWGSDGRLEVSVNQGDAAERLGVGVDSEVLVYWRQGIDAGS